MHHSLPLPLLVPCLLLPRINKQPTIVPCLLLMLIKPSLLLLILLLPLLNTLMTITKIKPPEYGARRARAAFEAAELGFQYPWMSISDAHGPKKGGGRNCFCKQRRR